MSTDVAARHVYFGKPAAILTQHEKDVALAPVFDNALAIRLVLARGLNTDLFGSFTRETPRCGSQADAAHRKAWWAARLSHLDVGIGSEGAFVPGPFGVGGVDIELLTWVDMRRRVRITGSALGASVHHHDTVRDESELRAAAERCRFPTHAVVVRPDDADAPGAQKGITTWPELAAAFGAALRDSSRRQVFIENDLRAHVHPTRMAIIVRAAEDLVARLMECCPRCATPGFGRFKAIPGNPCRSCRTPTTEAFADEYACVKCDFRERRDRIVSAAPPDHCPNCNP